MKFYLTLVFALNCIFAFPQDSTSKNKIYVKEFDWQIVIPKGYDTVSSKYMNNLEAKGKEMIEETINKKIENNTKTLFTFRRTAFNFLESNFQNFDEKVDGNYKESCNYAYNILYESFKKQKPEAQVDSSFGIEIFDNITFYRFLLKIQLENGVVMNMYMFNHLFEKKDLTISVIYVSIMDGVLLLESLRKSKFNFSLKQ